MACESERTARNVIKSARDTVQAALNILNNALVSAEGALATCEMGGMAATQSPEDKKDKNDQCN